MDMLDIDTTEFDMDDADDPLGRDGLGVGGTSVSKGSKTVYLYDTIL
jgi:hypothetical protein